MQRIKDYFNSASRFKAFIQAIEEQNIETIAKYLAQNEKEVNRTFGFNNKTPLLLATATGNPEIVDKLIKAGADVNKADPDCNTPLSIAMTRGFVDLVDLLVKAGADVNKADLYNKTPLRKAAYDNNIDMIERMLQKADINQISYKGTVLTYAAGVSKPETVKYLLDKGADPNIVDNEHNSALMVALKKSKYENAQVILDYNPDITIINKFGQSAKNLNGSATIANLLRKKEAMIELKVNAEPDKILSQNEAAIEPGMPMLFSPKNELAPSAPTEEIIEPGMPVLFSQKIELAPSAPIEEKTDTLKSKY